MQTQRCISCCAILVSWTGFRGEYEAPLAVIAVNLVAGTSRDVSTEIARKVEVAAATADRDLASGCKPLSRRSARSPPTKMVRETSKNIL